MHELSLCRSIAGIVDRARDDRGVDVVHLQVGHLRQVVPETLEFCWGLVTTDGPLAGSALAIDHVPLLLSCRDCAAETTPAHALLLACVDCGSSSVDVVRGEELLVTSLDLTPAPSATPATSAPVPAHRPQES